MHPDQKIQLINPLSDLAYAGATTVSAAGALALIAAFLLRGGLGDSGVTIATLYLMAIAPIWLSAWALNAFDGAPLSKAISSMVSLMLGMLLPLLSLMSRSIALGSVIVALALGVWGIRRTSPLAWSARGSLTAITALSGALLILLTIPMRLYMQEALLLGTANSDNYLHSANMQMLLHYGRIAIGADGLGYQNYHWLFHILVVGAAKATASNVTLVYGYWTGIVLKLQLVWALFLAGLVLYPEGEQGATAWRLAYAWLTMLLAGGFEMESYMLGVAIFAAWLPLLLALLRAAPSMTTLSLTGLPILVLGAFVSAGAKSSVGYYCAIGIFLLAWHYRMRIPVVIALLGSLIGLAAFANGLLIPKDLLLGSAGLSVLAMSYLIYVERGIIWHYLLAPLLAVGFAWAPRGSWRNISRSIAFDLVTTPTLSRDESALPRWLEHDNALVKFLRWLVRVDERAQMLLLSLLGMLFVVLTMPIGDNLWDFSVVLFMMSLLLLPVALGEILNARFTDKSVKWLLALALTAETILAGAQFALNSDTSLKQTLLALYRSAGHFRDGESSGAAKDIVLSLKTSHKPLTRLQALIASSPVSQLKQDLEARNHAAEGHLAVQVTPAATEIWHFFEKSDSAKWCLYPHLLVPATAGLVEVRSIPSATLQQACMVPGVVWYGYGKYQDLHRTADFTPAQLCTMGKTVGAREIYRLVSITDLSRNQVIDCRHL